VLVAGRRYRWPHAITPGRDGLITAPLTLMQSRQALPKTVDPRLTGRPAAQATRLRFTRFSSAEVWNWLQCGSGVRQTGTIRMPGRYRRV
jgi:hypothetical protein